MRRGNKYLLVVVVVIVVVAGVVAAAREFEVAVLAQIEADRNWVEHIVEHKIGEREVVMFAPGNCWLGIDKA